jgi:5'-deoxynucleotidase YfbR-like HD superfamily hydrolase
VTTLSPVGKQLLHRGTSYVNRWHREPVIRRDESLAEHHSITGRIAYEVGLLLVYDRWDVRPELLCVVGNYHDEPELITGDFPKGLKYGELLPTDTDLFDKLEVLAADKLWRPYPEWLRLKLRDHALRQQLNEVEEQVIKYADSLSALGFMLDEAAFGNQLMHGKAEQEWETVHAYDWPWLVQLRERWELP